MHEEEDWSLVLKPKNKLLDLDLEGAIPLSGT